MPKRWIALAALAALAVACGPSEKAEKAAADAARKTEWTWLEGAKRDLDAQRQQLETLEAQVATNPEIAAQAEALHKQVDAAEDALGQRLATYINGDPPLVGEPLKPEQLAAVRMKSSEDMVIAREFIRMGGDYRKAIDIYKAALIADPDNSALKAAVETAEKERWITAERFAQVKKGMTEAEVKALIGAPYYRNVKEYPDRNVTAWFYPKNESGDAAGIWFSDKKVVYQLNFDAVETSSGG
jgi:hypothetical protein